MHCKTILTFVLGATATFVIAVPTDPGQYSQGGGGDPSQQPEQNPQSLQSAQQGQVPGQNPGAASPPPGAGQLQQFGAQPGQNSPQVGPQQGGQGVPPAPGQQNGANGQPQQFGAQPGQNSQGSQGVPPAPSQQNGVNGQPQNFGTAQGGMGGNGGPPGGMPSQVFQGAGVAGGAGVALGPDGGAIVGVNIGTTQPVLVPVQIANQLLTFLTGGWISIDPNSIVYQGGVGGNPGPGGNGPALGSSASGQFAPPAQGAPGSPPPQSQQAPAQGAGTPPQKRYVQVHA